MASRITSLCGGSGRRIVVREIVAWYIIQQTETGAYSWTMYDTLVTDCANMGFEILMMLGNSPLWSIGASGAGDSGGCLPFADVRTLSGNQSAAQAYATFAGAVAARYGPNGTFWQANPSLPYYPTIQFEVWNEPYVPNTACRWNGSAAVPTTPNGAEYAAIFSLVAPAIHATTGAKAMAAIHISRQDNSAEYARPFFAAVTTMPDSISTHPYPVNYQPASMSEGRSSVAGPQEWQRNVQTFDLITDIRLAMNEAGIPHAEMWITEVGWATQTATAVHLGATQAAAEAQQAARYNDMFEYLRRHDRMIQGLVPYCHSNPFYPDQSSQSGYNPYDPNCWLGLYHTDGSGGAFDGATSTAKPAAAVVIAQAAIGIPAFD
jgi:hypothetical protein